MNDSDIFDQANAWINARDGWFREDCGRLRRRARWHWQLVLIHFSMSDMPVVGALLALVQQTQPGLPLNLDIAEDGSASVELDGESFIGASPIEAVLAALLASPVPEDEVVT